MLLKMTSFILTMPVLMGVLYALCSSFTQGPGTVDQWPVLAALQDTLPVADSAADKIFEKVEIEAAYPGGDDAWRKFLENNINAAVATDYGAPNGNYTVIVQFVVDREGKVSDIKALTRHGYGMEAEVIRLLKKAPRWSPAIQDGRMVRAYRKQPVTFVVTAEKKRKNKN